MSHDQPDPKLLELEPNGLYTTPIASGFLGMAIEGGSLPVQIRLSFAGGAELRIPMSNLAVNRMLAQCAGLYQSRKDQRTE
ncbi:hypothetical protein [Ferrovibrio terrae]|uniref:hypothetical protein n=1 Tax=Ferrovibrio terrae TaxID=2594003 RepID=UPI0031380182